MRTAAMTIEQRCADLLGWLTFCAVVGWPCPHNWDIAHRYGYANDGSGSALIKRLERAGKIRVFRQGKNRHCVEIVATGARTAPFVPEPRTRGPQGQVLRWPARVAPSTIPALYGDRRYQDYAPAAMRPGVRP